MGAALAACVDGEVLWASEGRSQESAARAREVEIVDIGRLRSLVAAAEMVISVCPPAAAVELAEQVSQMEFDGLYADVNAVSPATARQIGQLFTRFVDGGIVGPPPLSPRATSAQGDATKAKASHPSGTRLYLSGEEAQAVAALFTGSTVEVRVMGPEPGQASALKTAYAAWTKGTSALLLSVAALATSEEVIEELLDEWDTSLPELRKRLEQGSARIGEKAWRFVGEMEEIAHAHGDAGLPDGFHLAAAEIYSRLADLRDHPSGQVPDEVSNILLDRNRDRSTNS
jgi:hypothetical protein